MQLIKFAKMHGLHNDFMVIDGIYQTFSEEKIPFPLLSNRHAGIGFDQALLLKPGKAGDFFCQIYNADGSQAEQCGNGLRCIARYIHETNLHHGNQFTLETVAGKFKVKIEDYEHIFVEMGLPIIEKLNKPMQFSQASYEVNILSLGNPHAILRVDSLNQVSVNILGKEISTAKAFARGCNVGFMQVENPHTIRLRTYERGSGETFACGSNAVAAAVVGIKNGWLKSPVKVRLAFGELEISWPDENKPLLSCGPAAMVYMGEIFI